MEKKIFIREFCVAFGLLCPPHTPRLARLINQWCSNSISSKQEKQEIEEICAIVCLCFLVRRRDETEQLARNRPTQFKVFSNVFFRFSQFCAREGEFGTKTFFFLKYSSNFSFD
jgi:hypothetical protein